MTVRCPSNGRSASSTSGLRAPAAQSSAGRVACSCLPWPAMMPRRPHRPYYSHRWPGHPSTHPHPLLFCGDGSLTLVLLFAWASTAASSPSTAAGLHQQIRHRQAVSEQAERLFVIVVSSATVSPSPRARPRPLTTMAIGAEARRRHPTSPSWPQPRWVATEHAIVFNALAGARSTPARPSSYLLATSLTSPELRQPQRSSPPAFSRRRGQTRRSSAGFALRRPKGRRRPST